MRPARAVTDNPLTVAVLRGLAEGLSDQDIAQRVHVSPRTLQRTVDAFKASAGARTRFAAGVAACRLGLLDGSDHPVDGVPRV